MAAAAAFRGDSTTTRLNLCSAARRTWELIESERLVVAAASAVLGRIGRARARATGVLDDAGGSFGNLRNSLGRRAFFRNVARLLIIRR